MWHIQVEAERIGDTEKRIVRIRLIHDKEDPPPQNTETIRELLMEAQRATPWDIKRLSIIELGTNQGRRRTDG